MGVAASTLMPYLPEVVGYLTRAPVRTVIAVDSVHHARAIHLAARLTGGIAHVGHLRAPRR
jgi:hypothetical protein